MRILKWAFRATVFFVLFAFALNNQHAVEINWFFGVATQAPMVLVVLAVFVAGTVVGVLAMLPGWWRQHRRTRSLESAVPRPLPPGPSSATGLASETEVTHPPRDGV